MTDRDDDGISCAGRIAAFDTSVAHFGRVYAQVTELFGGLSLVASGVVPVTGWRPGIPDPLAQPADLYGGLARVPAERT